MWPFKRNKNELMTNALSEFEQILAANEQQARQLYGRGVDNYRSGGYDNADRLHQIFCDFGYPESLEFTHFWNMYRRFGPAKCVVNTMPDICWSKPPMVEGSESFTSDFDALVKKLNLWNRLKGLDKRQRVGAYAGLFIEVRDNKDPREPMDRVSGLDAIENLKPIYEGQLTVNNYNADGSPISYQYQPNLDGTRNPNETQAIQIHPSRLIVWAEGADDGSIYGLSELECVYNDLMDMRKLSGASAEGGYQNSRSIPVFSSEAGFQAPKDTGSDNPESNPKLKFDEAIEDWLNKWRKKLVLNGIKPHFHNVSIPNPKESYQAALNNVAAGSGLPQAWITGAITGVLAGNKDFEKIMIDGNSRRENFLVEAVSKVIDWFIMYGVLPTSEYEIEWSDLLTPSDADKVKLVREMAAANRENFLAGGGRVFSEGQMLEAAGYELDELEDMPSEEMEDDDED